MLVNFGNLPSSFFAKLISSNSPISDVNYITTKLKSLSKFAESLKAKNMINNFLLLRGKNIDAVGGEESCCSCIGY